MIHGPAELGSDETEPWNEIAPADHHRAINVAARIATAEVRLHCRPKINETLTPAAPTTVA